MRNIAITVLVLFSVIISIQTEQSHSREELQSRIIDTVEEKKWSFYHES